MASSTSWGWWGSIGGKAGSVLELAAVCQRPGDGGLGPLVLPAPTRRELMAARLSAPADRWWEDRVRHAELCPVKDRTP
ncbi:hypothetical protein [Kitasatospora purpeofusca]|uniref:hypothetical protein n=1 Tax=Kitasatospora purpeofusca TaxID=67352 RepID=UPI0036D21ECE